MRFIILIFIALITLSFTINPDCGDGKVYANKKQTELDKRFDNYLKIKSVPKFKGGSKKLNIRIREELKLSDVAKTQIFNLNYQFTVTCEGKIKDVKSIGDPKAKRWTNISSIIKGTEGNWKPAKKDGNTVDCVYFGRLFINGGQY